MGNENFNYTFFGKVLPERAGFDLEERCGKKKFETKYRDEHTEVDIETSIYRSQIISRVRSDQKVENIANLRNVVETSVLRITDVISFVERFAFEIDIVSYIGPDGDRRTFGAREVALDPLVEDIEEYRSVLERVYSLYQIEESMYLQRCLSDLRRALKYPSDTGVYCYRAIEFLRQYFVYVKGVKDKDDSWQTFADAINKPEDYIKVVSNDSKAQRHGDRRYLKWSERENFFNKTWDVVQLFIDYFEQEHQGKLNGLES